jgi:hypothetical protein
MILKVDARNSSMDKSVQKNKTQNCRKSEKKLKGYDRMRFEPMADDAKLLDIESNA